MFQEVMLSNGQVLVIDQNAAPGHRAQAHDAAALGRVLKDNQRARPILLANLLAGDHCAGHELMRHFFGAPTEFDAAGTMNLWRAKVCAERRARTEGLSSRQARLAFHVIGLLERASPSSLAYQHHYVNLDDLILQAIPAFPLIKLEDLERVSCFFGANPHCCYRYPQAIHDHLQNDLMPLVRALSGRIEQRNAHVDLGRWVPEMRPH